MIAIAAITEATAMTMMTSTSEKPQESGCCGFAFLGASVFSQRSTWRSGEVQTSSHRSTASTWLNLELVTFERAWSKAERWEVT